MQKNKMRKVVSGILVVGILTNYFLGGLSRVDAKTNYKAYTTGDVNFRREPNTNDNTADGNINIITSIDANSTVTVVSDDIVGYTNCRSGWKQIVYNNTKGYICSAYLSEKPIEEKYDRPWNTPKKAIMGGAKWIGSGYISRGQFTSYLKKFNVNPKADSSLYNHQYQTNIAAPSSESVTTYNAYKNQGFLDLQFVFNIPIFNNMADRYDRYVGYDKLGTNRQIKNLVDNIPVQDNKRTVRTCRIFKWHNDFLTWCEVCKVFQVFSNCLTSTCDTVSMKEPICQQVFHNRRHTTDFIEVLEDILTRWFQVGQVRHTFLDCIEVLKGQINISRMGNSKQVKSGICRTTESHRYSDGIFKGFTSQDI